MHETDTSNSTDGSHLKHRSQPGDENEVNETEMETQAVVKVDRPSGKGERVPSAVQKKTPLRLLDLDLDMLKEILKEVENLLF